MEENKKSSGKEILRELTAQEIEKDKERSLAKINKEFEAGFDFKLKYPKSVSFFGSTRASVKDPHYRKAEQLAKMITKGGYAIVTGGGPGIMEAANKGAIEAGGVSLGLTINLPQEQSTNNYLTDKIDFNYFFTRKTALSFAAEAYIFFPGGYGTLDEFFEILTLVQTRKIREVPIILVGRDYWLPLIKFLDSEVCENHQAINKEELNLFEVVDDNEEILRKINLIPVQNWWKNF